MFRVYTILFIQYLFYSLDKIRKLENRIKIEKITKLELRNKVSTI